MGAPSGPSGQIPRAPEPGGCDGGERGSLGIRPWQKNCRQPRYPGRSPRGPEVLRPRLSTGVPLSAIGLAPAMRTSIVRSALLRIAASRYPWLDDLEAVLQRERDYGDLFDANKRDYVAVWGRLAVKKHADHMRALDERIASEREGALRRTAHRKRIAALNSGASVASLAAVSSVGPWLTSS